MERKMDLENEKRAPKKQLFTVTVSRGPHNIHTNNPKVVYCIT